MTRTLKKLFLTQLFFFVMVWGGGPSALANPVESSTDDTEATRSSTGVTEQYKCVQNGDKYSTMALTERGPIELIVWESTFWGDQWTPTTRCQTVSRRFQVLSDQGRLKFINIGQMNNENVICATTKTGKEGCLPDGLLITLEPKDNPYDVLEALFYSRKDPSAGAVRRSDGKPIDLQQLLRERSPLQESENVSNPPSVLPKTPNKREPLGEDQVTPQRPPLPW